MYLFTKFTPQTDNGLDGAELFGGVCIIVFVMMFLSIDKQLLI